MNSDADTQHKPVLLREVIEMIQAHCAGTYLDCTLGGAGHTRAILDAHPNNRVISTDRDASAIARGEKILAPYADRLSLRQARFSELKNIVEPHSLRAIVADLGISTDQLRAPRGFSFQNDSRLDMRMDATQDKSAHELVNNASEEQLFKVFKQGGVGREARAIAQAIVRSRPIETTAKLAAIIAKAAYGKSSKRGVHPATVPFQAIRIAVNDEFEEIEALLDAIPELLMPSGRAAIITFHSLEDTIVTRRMRAWQRSNNAPAWWPRAKGSSESKGQLLTPKGMRARQEECEENASARSARLRVFEFF